MNRTRWFLLAGLAILLLGGSFVVLNLMNRPMSQTLTLTTPTQFITKPVPTHTAIPEKNAPTSEKKTPTVVAAVPQDTPTIPPTGVPKICGNTGKMRLLVIGLTLPTDGERLAADAIRLVTIDFDQPSATIMALPALLWVDTPVLADLDVEQSQLSAVYMEAHSRVKSDSERFRTQMATQAIAQTIVDNFGFVPDHYITVDEQAFIKYVDTLGGIEVNLPQAVDGTAEEYGIYPAGGQLLDGARALNFTRLFHPDGVEDRDVWGNLARQKLIVRGILDASLKPQNITKIPTLINEVPSAVVTDLSFNQTFDLACMAEKVGETTQILGVTEEMVSLDEAGRLIPDLEVIQQQIAQMEISD